MGPSWARSTVLFSGIGGLAVAFTLCKSGHRVRVLERRDLSAPSGGMRVPPNLSKILRRWVGEEELAKVTTRCVGTPFHHCEFLRLIVFPVSVGCVSMTSRPAFPSAGWLFDRCRGSCSSPRVPAVYAYWFPPNSKHRRVRRLPALEARRNGRDWRRVPHDPCEPGPFSAS